jgi:hypothetical protein
MKNLSKLTILFFMLSTPLKSISLKELFLEKPAKILANNLVFLKKDIPSRQEERTEEFDQYSNDLTKPVPIVKQPKKFYRSLEDTRVLSFNNQEIETEFWHDAAGSAKPLTQEEILNNEEVLKRHADNGFFIRCLRTYGSFAYISIAKEENGVPKASFPKFDFLFEDPDFKSPYSQMLSFYESLKDANENTKVIIYDFIGSDGKKFTRVPAEEFDNEEFKKLFFLPNSYNQQTSRRKVIMIIPEQKNVPDIDKAKKIVIGMELSLAVLVSLLAYKGGKALVNHLALNKIKSQISAGKLNEEIQSNEAEKASNLDKLATDILSKKSFIQKIKLIVGK